MVEPMQYLSLLEGMSVTEIRGNRWRVNDIKNMWM